MGVNTYTGVNWSTTTEVFVLGVKRQKFNFCPSTVLIIHVFAIQNGRCLGCLLVILTSQNDVVQKVTPVYLNMKELFYGR